jgi:hypothetical protein
MDPIPSWQNRTPDHNATNSGDHVAPTKNENGLPEGKPLIDLVAGACNSTWKRLRIK